MLWAWVVIAFVGMWVLLGAFFFQVLRYVQAKAKADARGEGWDEGL